MDLDYDRSAESSDKRREPAHATERFRTLDGGMAAGSSSGGGCRARRSRGGAAALAGASVPSAAAPAPPTPWDGTNPFHCTVQDAGQGTTVPDPGADPYCVHFDKTGQNVSQLGLVDFLLKEPARVAAAVPKCFYYQEDHWRGSLTPGGPTLYEFTGHYFFNKATGDGGVWVTGFTRRRPDVRPDLTTRLPPGVRPVLRSRDGRGHHPR